MLVLSRWRVVSCCGGALCVCCVHCPRELRGKERVNRKVCLIKTINLRRTEERGNERQETVYGKKRLSRQS